MAMGMRWGRECVVSSIRIGDLVSSSTRWREAFCGGFWSGWECAVRFVAKTVALSARLVLSDQ
jgi:hypothetical protein